MPLPAGQPIVNSVGKPVTCPGGRPRRANGVDDTQCCTPAPCDLGNCGDCDTAGGSATPFLVCHACKVSHLSICLSGLVTETLYQCGDFYYSFELTATFPLCIPVNGSVLLGKLHVYTDAGGITEAGGSPIDVYLSNITELDDVTGQTRVTFDAAGSYDKLVKIFHGTMLIDCGGSAFQSVTNELTEASCDEGGGTVVLGHGGGIYFKICCSTKPDCGFCRCGVCCISALTKFVVTFDALVPNPGFYTDHDGGVDLYTKGLLEAIAGAGEPGGRAIPMCGCFATEGGSCPTCWPVVYYEGAAVRGALCCGVVSVGGVTYSGLYVYFGGSSISTIPVPIDGIVITCCGGSTSVNFVPSAGPDGDQAAFQPTTINITIDNSEGGCCKNGTMDGDLFNCVAGDLDCDGNCTEEGGGGAAAKQAAAGPSRIAKLQAVADDAAATPAEKEAALGLIAKQKQINATRREEAVAKSRAVWGPKMWAEIHGIAKAWTSAHQAQIRLRQITAMIPCGECSTHWRQLLKQHPADFSSAWAYFVWSVERHNDVNVSLGKPVMDVAAAAAFRGMPTPAGG